MSAERSAFRRNALASYGQRGALGLSAVLLTPYLFRQLGSAGFGTWSVMFTLTTVFTMLEIGFSAGSTKFVAEYRARAEPRQLDRAVGASVALMAALGCVALAFCVAAGTFADGLAADAERDAFRNGMLIIGVAFLARFPFVAYGATLAGYQRFDAFNAAQVVTIIGFAVGAVVAIEAGGGVEGLAVAYGAALVVGGAAFAPLLRVIDPTVRLLPRPSDRRALGAVMRFNSFTLLADAMIFLGVRMDTVVIAALRGAAAAGPFAAASKLQNGLQAPTLPVINLLMPMVADLHARGRHGEIRRRLVLATRVTLQVTIPMAAAVALFAADIVDAWLGEDAPEVTAALISVLAVQTVMLCAVPADKVLVGMGRARTVGILNMAEGLSNLGISIVLVSAYGAIGAGIGTLVTSALIGPWKFPLACRALRLRLAHFARHALLTGVTSSMPAVAVMLPAWLLLPQGGTRVAVGISTGLGVAAVVGAIQVGPGRVRAELRHLVRRRPPQAEPETSQLLAQGPS